MKNNNLIDDINSSFGLTSIFVFSVIAVLLFFASNELGRYYPDWAYDGFVIPWTLSLIFGVISYNNNNNERIDRLVIRTTIPLIILCLPLLSGIALGQINPIFRDCSQGCIIKETTPEMIGFEPYCVYVATASIFILLFIPFKNKQ